MSSGSSRSLSRLRVIVFWKTVLCSVIVIFLSADLLSSIDLILAPFALATAVLSKLTVITMFFVDLRRQGSFFSYIVVEIVALSVLWAVWLSVGSYAAWTYSQLTQLTITFMDESESYFDFSGDDQTFYEIEAIAALSFLAGILLMLYTIVLVVLAIRAKGRGNPAWTTSVRDGGLFYPVQKATGGTTQVQTALATTPYSLPPPQQHLPPQPPPQQPYHPYPSSYPIPKV